ncbi:MAG: acyl-CoA thioesterase [Hyphomonadaceae bacterium]
MSAMNELLETLTLEPIEVNLFRGRTPPNEQGRIFGGQVIAQALFAAYKTIDGRVCHSLQSYFIRPGDPSVPVLYQVERSRDGKSFTTRRVIAIQHGEQILNLACSFHTPETGYEHQSAAPSVLPVEVVADWRSPIEEIGGRTATLAERAIELRPVNPMSNTNPKPMPPEVWVWCRAREDVGEDLVLNQAMLAYASDISLLGTAMRPHGLTWGLAQTASLDHIIWFHRPTNFSRWHLFAQDSPSASGGRGFNRGEIFREDGVLIASVAQEGLIRPLRPG